MTKSDLKLDFINIACNAKKKRKLRAVARRRGQSLVAAELELNVPSPGISGIHTGRHRSNLYI